MKTYNGMPGTDLSRAIWRRSSAGGLPASCVELANLGNGEFALRNSRHPGGPALIYTRAEIEALIEGVKNGEFDDLVEDVPHGAPGRPDACPEPEGPLG